MLYYIVQLILIAKTHTKRKWILKVDKMKLLNYTGICFIKDLLFILLFIKHNHLQWTVHTLDSLYTMQSETEIKCTGWAHSAHDHTSKYMIKKMYCS